LVSIPLIAGEFYLTAKSSADTGIIASLLLHGQPPFHVTYMMKHESDPWLSLEEHFSGSRGKILLQPEERGRYQYLFTKISDAHYKNVDIIGTEKIEQTVRPLALAQFARSAAGKAGNLEVSSCEGTSVEVDVELKVPLVIRSIKLTIK
jgi:nucleoporin POM152